MADRIYHDWEAKLKSLLDSVEKELAEVRAQKEALFSLNTDRMSAIEGRVIHDDRRLILSAPEIVIGNVNMGGMLDPAGGCTIIIRGNQVAVEGVGSTGSVETRAPIITQTAENPGIDGTEHTVESVSKVIIQGREVAVDTSDMPSGGAFLDARTVSGGSGIALYADKRIDMQSVSSKKSVTNRLEDKIKGLKSAKEALKKEAKDDLDKFKEQVKELSEINDERDKLRLIDEDELTSKYHDIDDLNRIIDELSPQLADEVYRQSANTSKLAELNRQEKFFTKMKDEVGKISDDDFKKKPVKSAISIQTEKLSMASIDGDGNLRTDEASGVNIRSNRMSVEGVFDDKGSLDKNNRFTVNMKTVELSTAGRSGVEQEEKDGTLKTAKLPAEGDVIITSKNITMQTINAEVADKKYKDTGLVDGGSITIRSKSIGLSNVNTTDVEADDKGKVTKATYKPEGEILLFSKNVQISSMESKLNGDKVEETALAKDSIFSVRAEKMSLSAADHEGKASGQATINAKQVTVSAMNVDPKTKKFKEVAQGGSIEVYAEKETLVAKKDLAVHGEENAQFTSTKKLLVNGQETTEVKQDSKNLLTLSGGNTDLSGGKVTVSGDTTVKALTSPLVSADKLEVKSALKTPNIQDGMFVATKDTSPGSSKIEIKKESADVNKEALDGGAATEKNQGDALGNMAAGVLNNALGIALKVGYKKPGEEKKQ
jgi:hypothetical protein